MSDRAARSALLTPLLALSLGACAAPVLVDRDEAVPVPARATWAWARRDSTARYEREPAFNDEILNQRLQRAIDTAMQAKGFRRVDDPSTADFILSYHMGLMGGGHGGYQRSAVAIGVGFGSGWPRGGPYGYGSPYLPWGWYSPWGWYGPWGWNAYGSWGWFGPPVLGPRVAGRPTFYRDGALLLLLRQRTTGLVAWQGQYVMDRYDARHLTQEQAQHLVDRLLADLR